MVPDFAGASFATVVVADPLPPVTLDRIELVVGAEDGDLTPLFSGYFDTSVGSKKEAISYQKIAQIIELAPQKILFLSDIKEELDAAQQSGMQTVWLLRDGVPGNADAAKTHRQAHDFDGFSVE